MSRAYSIEPKLGRDGDWHILTLTEGGKECGGGKFPWAIDLTGFDAGYQDALDQGEEWIFAGGEA